MNRNPRIFLASFALVLTCIQASATGRGGWGFGLRSSCPGDLNNDGFVDDSDFVQFAGAYDILDCADPAMAPGCPADLNGDGFVDDSDFVAFAAAYNELLCAAYDLRNNLPGVQAANLRMNAMESASDVQDATVAFNFIGDGRAVNFIEVYFVTQSSSGIPNGWNPSIMDFRITGRYGGTMSYAIDPLNPTGPNDWQQVYDTPSNADWLTPIYTSSGYNVYRGQFFFPSMLTISGQMHSITWSGYGNIPAAGKTQLLFSNNQGGSFGAADDWRWINSGASPRSFTAAGAPFPAAGARIGFAPPP